MWSWKRKPKDVTECVPPGEYPLELVRGHVTQSGGAWMVFRVTEGPYKGCLWYQEITTSVMATGKKENG
jgi:hypothetical protein